MDKRFLSPDEAAKALGVSRAFMFRLLAENLLPKVKVGKRTLIPIEVVELLAQKSIEEGDFKVFPFWWKTELEGAKRK